MPPVITALYGALNAIFNIFLANEVSRQRGKSKVSIGEGSDPAMLVAIRAHGNNAEFVPLAIVMMLLCELCGGNRAVLHIFGGLLLFARVAHWVGLPRKAPNPFRFSGVALTWGMIAGASGYALYLRFTI
ncbi:MAG: MAPEG family protein [Deltaproteobacteria bacterium]|nr:MAPEG family protein [Deltaproteobacteria bacterium]MCW5804952.1 MAPEG family protein [Deltaproteobacteria bacterium]